jgi:hypothetical protein
LKDYHIYYPLVGTFQEFVATHQLWRHYPTTFAYECGRYNSFELYASISKYDIKSSVFYTDETEGIIRDCFYFMLEAFRGLFQKQGTCFEDMIFYPITSEARWIPFGQALFHPVLTQPDRQVVLSEREVYQCENNRWTYKTVILSEQGKQLMGYMMKEMEATLRQIVKFKYKLSANPNMCHGITRQAFEKMGIGLPQFIQSSVSAFYQEFTRIKVSVNHGSVSQIRAEALQTQEKLIVPEIEEVEVKHEVETEEIDTVTASPLDIWEGFKEILTESEQEALGIILAGGDIKRFATGKMIMLEVLVDEINQKAVDTVGDTILEFDDQLSIHVEYIEKIKFGREH